MAGKEQYAGEWDGQMGQGEMGSSGTREEGRVRTCSSCSTREKESRRLLQDVHLRQYCPEAFIQLRARAGRRESTRALWYS